MAAGPYLNDIARQKPTFAEAARALGAENCAQRQRDLPGGIDRLEREYASLVDVLAELDKRLNPVCAPRAEAGAHNLMANPDDPLSEYGSRLHSLAGQIRHTTQGVRDLLQRLEV